MDKEARGGIDDFHSEKRMNMLSNITEADFRILLSQELHTPYGAFTKIKDEETSMFGGTSGRVLVWKEGDHFFSHKSLVMRRHGQNMEPEFSPGSIQEVFPTEIVTTVYLSASQINLKEFYASHTASVDA